MEPSVAFALHQVMEEGGRLVLLQNGGEVVEPHPRFRLVCTANTLGHGDESGLYTGTKVLNAAFLDRFASIYEMGYPEPAVEKDILQRRVPDCSAALARKLVQTACDVRKARENEEVYCTFSTRRLIELARKHVQLGDLSSCPRTRPPEPPGALGPPRGLRDLPASHGGHDGKEAADAVTTHLRPRWRRCPGSSPTVTACTWSARATGAGRTARPSTCPHCPTTCPRS